MGIDSGSVNQVSDVNDRSNVTGAGINMAQRVMDCGDAGHILLSRRVAEDLEQYRRWQTCLHDLGECEVKHGVRIHVFNLYTDEVGNREVPAKLKPIAQESAAAVVLPSAVESLRSKHRLIAATILLGIALALGFGFWFVSRRAAPNLQKRSQSSPPPKRSGKPLDLPALAQKAKGAVVLIVGYDAAGKGRTGSGFFVSADGRLVTNYHVIEGIVNATAKLESGAIYNIGGVLASSPALDLAVLKADARDTQFFLVDGASSSPEPGTRIAVIGSPLALEGSLSEGIVSANRSMEDGSWLQFSAPISPGSSGSPVLDRHGRVVGVATKVAKEGQNLNFARSSHDLWDFLQTIHQDAKPEPLSERALWKKDKILSDPDFIAAGEANGRGDGAAALKLLNALGQRYPGEPRLLFQFAYAYETLGLHDEAYSSYRAYIDINPTDSATWRYFAIAAANLNQIDEAINACKQSLKMDPNAATWRMLGDLYGKQGQYALAAPAYDEAKRLEKVQHPVESSPASTPAQTPRDNRPIYVVIAPASKGLNIRSDHSSKSTTIGKLQQGDRVFLEDGRIRNEDPPYPVTWQKVTTMNGATGWINFDYLAPLKDENQGSTSAAPESPASSPATEETEVRRFFEKWLSVSNASDTEQEASLYADPADYLGFGSLSRQQLVQALQLDLQRWPNQHNTVSNGPLVEKLSESEWRVTFAINFDASDPSKGKQVTGTADITWLIRRRKSGELEIASAKEQVTARTRHDLKPEEMTIEDYFLLLPPDSFAAPPAAWLKSALIDVRNGYMSCTGDGAQAPFEVALFRFRDGKPLVAVCWGDHSEEARTGLVFLDFFQLGSDKKMHKVSRSIFPVGNAGNRKGNWRFELPRYGQTVLVRNQQTGKILNRLTWNGETFAPQQSSQAALQTPSPSVTPNDTGKQVLRKVYVKKYNLSVMLPIDVFPEANKLESGDAFVLSDSTQASVGFKMERKSVADAYRDCLVEKPNVGPQFTIGYKAFRNDWFVVSGEFRSGSSNGRGFYIKGVKAGGSVLFMQIEYKEENCPFSEDTFTAMSQSFTGKR